MPALAAPLLFGTVLFCADRGAASRPLLGQETETADELALELVVGHRLRQEVGAAEVTEALPGIGDHLTDRVALDRIGAVPFQRRLDRGRQAGGSVEPVMARRHLGGGA